MEYDLIITERAEELLDNLVYYLLFQLKNEQAARHLLERIENIYDRLSENPLQFPLCRDRYLADKGYREAIIPGMEYVIIFDVENTIVTISGVFHQLESYFGKV